MEMRKDLKQDAEPFKSSPYLTGPKTRELERSEINMNVKTEAIERAILEWAATVLFGPQKDGRLRFSIDYR